MARYRCLFENRLTSRPRVGVPGHSFSKCSRLCAARVLRLTYASHVTHCNHTSCDYISPFFRFRSATDGTARALTFQNVARVIGPTLAANSSSSKWGSPQWMGSGPSFSLAMCCYRPPGKCPSHCAGIPFILPFFFAPSVSHRHLLEYEITRIARASQNAAHHTHTHTLFSPFPT